MKYRNRTEIASQILEAANGVGTTKTRLMYKSFLSYKQLKEYTSVLVENGLLDFDETTQVYKTTEKGLWFLKLYNQLSECIQQPEIKSMPHLM